METLCLLLLYFKEEADMINVYYAQSNLNIYYAHHQWKYGTEIEEYELDLIK